MKADFFFISKHRKGEASGTILPAVSKEIQKHHSRHVFHTSVVYEVDDFEYIATHIKLEISDVKQGPEQQAVLKRAGEREGVGAFASGPCFSGANDRWIYLTHENSQYSMPCQRGFDNESKYVEEYVLMLGKRMFRVIQPQFSTTSLLRSLGSKYIQDEEVDQNSSSSFKIELKYVDDFSCVTQPKDTFEMTSMDSHELRICSSDVSASEITVTRIVCDLIELRSCMEWTDSGISFANISYGIESKTVYDISCTETLTREGVKDFLIPRELWDEVFSETWEFGPTFFSSNMTRSYALKVSVTFKSGNNCHKKSTVVDINKAYLHSRRGIGPYLRFEDSRRRILLSVERFPKELVTHDASNRKLEKVSTEYQLWTNEKASYTTKNHVISVCWSEIFILGNHQKPEGLPSLSSSKCDTYLEYELVAAKLFESPPSCRLVIVSKEDRISHSSSWAQPSRMGVSSLEPRVGRVLLTGDFIGSRPHIISAWTEIGSTGHLCQEMECPVFVPGFKLSDVLKIRVEHSFGEKFKAFGDNSEKPLSVSSIRIQLEKRLIENGEHGRVSSQFYQLVEKPINCYSLVEDFTPLASHYNPARSSYDSESGGFYLPSNYFDCLIPSLEPTQFNDRFFRSYFLHIDLDLSFANEGGRRRFTTGIIIANDPQRLFDSLFVPTLRASPEPVSLSKDIVAEVQQVVGDDQKEMLQLGDEPQPVDRGIGEPTRLVPNKNEKGVEVNKEEKAIVGREVTSSNDGKELKEVKWRWTLLKHLGL